CRVHGLLAAGAPVGGLGVVLVVVVVEVGAVVVVVACGPSTPTVSVTVAPLRAWLPPAGRCLSTTPTCDGSLVFAVAILGVSPAAPRAADAPASPWPTTFGTLTWLGACATVRLTLLPLGS